MKRTTTIKSYVNKRNPHKIIDVKHTADHHYMWRQRMVFENGVENPVGTAKGGFRRMNKATINEVLGDYEERSMMK